LLSTTFIINGESITYNGTASLIQLEDEDYYTVLTCAHNLAELIVETGELEFAYKISIILGKY
jgi:hypothetical protein